MSRIALPIAVLQAFAALALSQSELPRPTGEHRVGTTWFDWTDPRREELWTNDPDDRRRVVVQLWYPAGDTTDRTRAPYVPELDRLKPSLDQYWPDMPTFELESWLDAPLPEGAERYPCIVFSHGMNSGRSFYAAMLSDLASHGFVVAAIDHTYWGPGVAFADGRVAAYEDGMVARDELSSHEIDLMMGEAIAALAADQAFVLDRLHQLEKGELDEPERFRGRLDLSRVGVLGHSLGGMAAEAACADFAGFRAGMSLDGYVWKPVFVGRRPGPSAKPFLLLLSERGFADVVANEEAVMERYGATWTAPRIAVVRDSGHSNGTDYELLDSGGDAREAFDALRLCVRSFFRASLPAAGLEGGAALPDHERVEDLALF